MKLYILILKILLFAAIICGCSREKDTLMENADAGCEASLCHEATILKKHPPESGKHTSHLNFGNTCENCHNNYINDPHHSDSVLDIDNETIIVNFDSNSSDTVWDNSTGNCSFIGCHGGAPAELCWYENPDSNDPNTECTICHAAGSSIDPLSTSGSASNGKHIAHLTGTGIKCDLCHKDAMEKTTHMNGLYGKDEVDTIVHFSGLFNGATVSLEFDNETGSCDIISCHGNTGDVNWYSNNTGCTSCHSSGSTIDPVTTNSSGLEGKHSAHAEEAGIGCEICHSDYKTQQTHMNGIYGTAETIQIVSFDSSQLPGSLWNNSDSTCSNLTCHGSVPWYTDEPMTCTLCHVSGTNIDPLPSGSHYRHLNAGFDCSECHQDYMDEATHTNGTLNNPDNAPGMINFSDEHNPFGTRDSLTNSCSDLYCHGLFPAVNYNGSDINPGNNSNPVWGDPATAGCGSCHGNSDNNCSSLTHGSHTSSSHIPVVFNNMSKIESCDACHNYGNDSVRTFSSDSTQGSYNTSFHVNFSISNAGVNSDINFKEDNSDLASRTSPDTIIAEHTTWNAASTTCSNSWCHGNFTNGSGYTGNNATPNWLNPLTAQCGTCHERDTHDSIPNRCGRCHDGFGITGERGPVPGHINGTIYTP